MVLSSSVAYSRATAYVVSLCVSLCTHIFVYIRATQNIVSAGFSRLRFGYEILNGRSISCIA